MNGDHPLEPLTAEQLDELLSADLDGELAGAAADLGLTPDIARRHIAATPNAATRRAQLASARDALAQPDGIDDLLEARLRAKAVRAGTDAYSARRSERRGRHQRFASAVAIAAVVLVAIGTVAALARSKSNGTKSSSASPAKTTGNGPSANSTSAPRPTNRALPAARALGSYPSAQALASAVARSLGTNSTTADALQKLQASPAAQGATAAAPFGAVDNGAAAADCADEFTTLGGAGAPVLDGNAVVAGRPVHVRAYRGADETLVLVLDAGCNVLIRRADTR